MTTAILYLWAVLLGLALGSFVNVLVLRDDDRSSIITGRSRCPACRHPLAWYDLIPLLSFAVLGGRCRYCKKPISWQYPLVEAVAAALSVFSFWYGVIDRGSWLLAAGLAASLMLLLTVSAIDISRMEVPVEYCVAGGVIGGAVLSLTGVHSWVSMLEGLAAGAGIILAVMLGWRLFFHQDGMGEGDIWVAGAIGAILGYPLVLVGLLTAVLLGAIIGVAALGLSKKSLQTAIPFGPFLAAGLVLSLWIGNSFLQWYGWAS
ncbi:A24 family peptidase [Patescibacteria group bacterium]|nr:A24 family peptidase [Patescibacteria group bacterium]